MAANFYVYVAGLAVGSSLLALGGLLGYWLGKKTIPAGTVDRQQFLSFLKNLATWTNEYAGDVSRYQTQLTEIDEKFRATKAAVPHEIVQTLREIMDANRQLQSRLDSAEQKLDVQTNQISNVLVEARTDGLTGLLNRKAFDQALDGLFAQWIRQQKSFSMGMIDIDHFKHINDTYGHPAGDAVLRQISKLLQQNLAQEVCLARYGGEEFAVLSMASGEKLAAALERLRQHICQLKIEHESHTLRLSFSAGAAEVASQDKISSLVRRADEALYAAKTGGRNRVYRHDATRCILVTQVATLTAPPEASLTEVGAEVGAEVETEVEASQGPSDVAYSQSASRAQSATTKVAERLQRIVDEESQRLIQR